MLWAFLQTFQLYRPSYCFWGVDFFLIFFSNLAFWLPWQPTKLGGLDKHYVLSKDCKGPLNKHFWKTKCHSTYLEWDSNKCQFSLVRNLLCTLLGRAYFILIHLQTLQNAMFSNDNLFFFSSSYNYMCYKVSFLKESLAKSSILWRFFWSSWSLFKLSILECTENNWNGSSFEKVESLDSVHAHCSSSSS